MITFSLQYNGLTRNEESAQSNQHKKRMSQRLHCQEDKKEKLAERKARHGPTSRRPEQGHHGSD